MKLGLAALALAAALFGAVALTPERTDAQTLPPNQVPVTGDIAGGGTFEGVFTITRFIVQDGQLAAVGTLSGELTDALGETIGTVANVPLTIPVQDITGSCDILHLELGPLDLDLLGLVVHLDQIVLDIDAQSGPGNLLGNLLCAVAGLLDRGGPLAGISALLNNILRAL